MVQRTTKAPATGVLLQIALALNFLAVLAVLALLVGLCLLVALLLALLTRISYGKISLGVNSIESKVESE